MKNRIKAIILESIESLNEDLCNDNLDHPDEMTSLYGGKDSTLDSLALVNLIVDLEEKIEEVFGKVIVLSDEKAMSQRRSPFRSVKTLCDYIEALLLEAD